MSLILEEDLKLIYPRKFKIPNELVVRYSQDMKLIGDWPATLSIISACKFTGIIHICIEARRSTYTFKNGLYKDNSVWKEI